MSQSFDTVDDILQSIKDYFSEFPFLSSSGFQIPTKLVEPLSKVITLHEVRSYDQPDIGLSMVIIEKDQSKPPPTLLLPLPPTFWDPRPSFADVPPPLAKKVVTFKPSWEDVLDNDACGGSCGG